MSSIFYKEHCFGGGLQIITRIDCFIIYATIIVLLSLWVQCLEVCAAVWLMNERLIESGANLRVFLQSSAGTDRAWLE